MKYCTSVYFTPPNSSWLNQIDLFYRLDSVEKLLERVADNSEDLGLWRQLEGPRVIVEDAMGPLKKVLGEMGNTQLFTVDGKSG